MMTIEKTESATSVAFVISPFQNGTDTPNIGSTWLQVALDKRFGDIEIRNGIKIDRVNAFECSMIAHAWEKAGQIALALRDGTWGNIAVDKVVEITECPPS